MQATGGTWLTSGEGAATLAAVYGLCSPGIKGNKYYEDIPMDPANLVAVVEGYNAVVAGAEDEFGRSPEKST